MFNKYNSNSRGNDRGGDRFGNRGGSRGGDRGGDRSFGRPEMFRTTCADCGDSCEVPFRPANGKPIYCRSCFQNQDDAAPKFAGKSFNSSSFEKYRGAEEKRLFDAECSMCGIDCQVPFKPMAGRPVYCGTCMKNEDRMPMTGPKPVNAFSKSHAEAGNSNSGPSKAEFAALTSKVDRILKLLESVMEDAEADAKAEMEDGDFDEDFSDEDFGDMEEMEEVVEEVKPAKKASAKDKKAPAKEAAKKPTRGQVKRAKRTGKTL